MSDQVVEQEAAPAGPTDKQRKATYDDILTPLCQNVRDIAASIGCQIIVYTEMCVGDKRQLGYSINTDADIASPAMLAALALTMTGVPGDARWVDPPRFAGAREGVTAVIQHQGKLN